MIWGAEAEGGSGARSLAERMESRDALQRQDKAAQLASSAFVFYLKFKCGKLQIADLDLHDWYLFSFSFTRFVLSKL